jgi:hypothetical protein
LQRGLSGGQKKNIGHIYGPNLIVNGGFEIPGAGGADVFNTWLETPGTGGTIAAETTIFHTGATSAKQICNSTTHSNYLRTAALTVVPGQPYLLTRYIYGDGTNDGKLGVYDVTHSAYIKNYLLNRVIANGFVRRDTMIIPPAGCTSIQLFIFAPPVVGGTVYTDDVSIYAYKPPKYMYDNFNRADGDPVATPGGMPYELANTAGKPSMIIKDRVLTIPTGETGYWYSFFDFPAAAKKMTARFKWRDDYAGGGDSVVFAASNDRLKIQTYKHMLHFYITSTEWVFQTVDDAGTFTTLGRGNLTLAPLTEYTMAMVVSGNTVTLSIPTIADQVITDASIGTYSGQFVYYELIRTAVDKKSSEFTYIEGRW